MRRPTLSFLSILSISAVTLIAGSPAPFSLGKDYSVEMLTTIQGMETKTIMHVSGDKIRTESTVMGMQNIAILRKDKDIMWVVMPAQKTYMEMPLPKNTAVGTPDPNAKWEKIGDEAVDGKPAEKWKSTMQQGGQEAVMFYWIDKTTKLPLKAEMSGMVTYWKNYNEGAQDASLFELPAGYKKMEMPGMPAK